MKKTARGVLVLGLAQVFMAGACVQAADSADARAASVHPVVTRSAAPSVPLDEPELRSGQVFILDQTNAEVLYARQAKVARPIASITKLMTALVVIEAGQPLDELIEITPADRYEGKGDYSRLAIGTKLTRDDLLRLALMSSENRAAHALGRTYPGGMQAFIKAMNAKARELGMHSARFTDPSGLSETNVASAEDLAKLVIAAGENPLIREYSTHPEYTVKVGRQLLEYRNTNPLVRNPDWEIIVQKTGYLAAAGRCLVMQTVIDGRTIVMVLLNSFGKLTRIADARRVRRWMESAAMDPQLRKVSNET